MAVLRILMFLNSFHNVKDKKAMDFFKEGHKKYSLLIQQILIVFIMYKAKREY